MLTQKKGFYAEQKALNHLITQGLHCISRNYRCRCGEIDLIMRDGEYLVFVEVRARSSKHFGGGLASITYAKQQKIIRATSYYLLEQNLHDREAIRFDVVSIDGNSGIVTWIKDAFRT